MGQRRVRIGLPAKFEHALGGLHLAVDHQVARAMIGGWRECRGRADSIGQQFLGVAAFGIGQAAGLRGVENGPAAAQAVALDGAPLFACGQRVERFLPVAARNLAVEESVERPVGFGA